MRVGINAILYQPNRSGVEKAVKETVLGIAAANSDIDIRLFLSRDLKACFPQDGNGNRIQTRPVEYSTRLERIAKEQFLALRHNKTVDLWHFLGYVTPPFAPSKPIVVTIYDIIALTHHHLCTRANRLYYGWALPRTIHRADRIIVPSKYVKRRIVERFLRFEDKIRVLPLPLPKEIAAARRAETSLTSTASADGSLLFLGDLGPKKNVDFLLKTFATLPSDVRQKHPLKICGRAAGRLERYRALAEALGIAHQVRFEGYVPDPDLPALYRSAALLLYPSLEEGYGYPPLEAMALGTPAVVSDCGALPEIAGTAGATIAPLNPRAFADAILKTLSDKDSNGITKSPRKFHVPETSWSDYAQSLFEIYKELL